MELVSIQDCPTDASLWNVSGLTTEDYNFRVGGFQSNWGYQGNYQLDPATGFWPEFYNIIESAAGATFTRRYVFVAFFNIILIIQIILNTISVFFYPSDLPQI